MKASAWDDIGSPSDPSTETIRRADKDHPLEFFRGKDHLGRHLFMFRIRNFDRKIEELPNLAGIDVVYELVSKDLWQLKLTLRDAQQSDIFAALCANLMEATRRIRAGEQEKSVGIVLMRLRRWQQMLRVGRSDLMSESVQIGLFGELLFLRDILMVRLTPANALQCWRGPFGDEQDFAVGGALVEIKTQRSTSDRRLRISSADQLHSHSGRIVLCHQTLFPDTDSATGTSLNGLAVQVISDIEKSDPVAADLIRAVLIDFGYEERSEYDKPHRSLERRDFYEVGQLFPKITPEMLRSGIVEVSYSIEVESCLPFLADEETVWRDQENG